MPGDNSKFYETRFGFVFRINQKTVSKLRWGQFFPTTIEVKEAREHIKAGDWKRIDRNMALR